MWLWLQGWLDTQTPKSNHLLLSWVYRPRGSTKNKSWKSEDNDQTDRQRIHVGRHQDMSPCQSRYWAFWHWRGLTALVISRSVKKANLGMVLRYGRSGDPPKSHCFLSVCRYCAPQVHFTHIVDPLWLQVRCTSDLGCTVDMQGRQMARTSRA